MKTLALLRHAKSSWKNPSIPDIDRPLSKRGRRDAPLMGRRLSERKIDIELVVSSPATRALMTAEAIAEALEYPWDEIVVDDRLYHADVEHLMDVIEDQDAWVDVVMLVGHNPGLTHLVNYLSRAAIENVPTSGLVVLDYDVDEWTALTTARPTAMTFDYPKKPSD